MNNTFYIDDITWNDLNMDSVFERINTAKSSVGQEYLKYVLKNPSLDESVLKGRDAKSDFLENRPDTKKKLSLVFGQLGKTKKISFLTYIFRLYELPPVSNVIHIILAVLLILSIAALFIYPLAGIICIIVFFIINISTYFSAKSKIEGYFQCVKYLVSMVIAARKISGIQLEGTPFDSAGMDLRRLIKVFSSVEHGSWLITNSISGSIIDILMDYVRMLFHVDIIKFNSMLKTIIRHSDNVKELYTILGEIELSICINEYRNKLPFYSKPVFDGEICFENLCHPLVKHPVGNSLKIGRSILLTGSNASGKSTFLKSVAICQLMAQSIYTCYAKSYRSKFYKILSSMALNDNILNDESYFVVEVKSLKRILNEIGEMPVLCFVDEVLRGTNTQERIAASFAVLKSISTSNAVCLAATHDIELTDLLSEYMNNYHFTEQVINNDVVFDYSIKPGPSTSKNAIKLLESYDFPSQIVMEAKNFFE